jgi:hypothetical protein
MHHYNQNILGIIEHIVFFHSNNVHGFLCDHLLSDLLKICLCSIILYQELARVVTQRLNEDFEQILWNVVVF